MAKKFDLSVIFRVTDRITRPVKKITRSIGDMTKSVNKFGLASKVAFSKVDVSLRKLDRRFDKVGKRIERTGFTRIGKRIGSVGRDLATKLTLPMTILGGVIAKRSIDFETAWTGVRKTVTASKTEFEKLKKELMAMALEIPISTTEIFGIAEAAGQLGVKTKDIVSFTKVMADLGATTNLTSEEAAISLARFANITGLATEDFENLGSTIVDLGNNTETTEREIVAMALRLASSGNTIGLTEAQIVSLAASLSSVGLEAEAGGTAFSQVMKKIGKEIGTGSKKMQDFALISGKSVEGFEKAWKENAGLAIIDFTEGLAQIQKEGANVNIVLDELGFEGIRISDSLLRASGAGEKFRDNLKLGNAAWKANIALVNEANLRYGTSASKLTIAKNKADQLAAAYGDVLVPVILKVVEAFTPLINGLKSLDSGTKSIIIAIALFVGIVGPLVILLGAFLASIGFIAGIFGIAVAPVLAFIGGIMMLVGLAVLVIAAWGPVVQTFKNLIDNLKNLKSFFPDFIKDFGNIRVDADRDLNDTSGLSDTSKRLLGITNESKTQIDLRVSADSGSTVNTGRIKQKKGKSNVNLMTVGYVGAG